jgi:hypothetical protein
MNDGPANHEDRDKGFLGKTLGVLLGTEKILLRVAAVITAIGVIIGAVALLSHHKASPDAREASFLGTSVQPDVLLEQYEDENTTLNADTQAGDTSGTRREASLVAFTTIAATTPTNTPTTAAVPPPATSFSSPEAEIEEAASLSHEAKAKQTQAQSEVKAQKEEARDRQAGAIDEQSPEEPRTNQREQDRLQRARQLQQQAKTETEDARLKSSEAEKLKQEEEHPNSAPQQQQSSPTQLHREGSAEVAVGTAPPRDEVEAVVKQSGVPLPASCGESCAISPVIDKALSEYAANTDAAARQVASIFHDSRQGVFGHRRQPLGVAVHFSVDLVGYEGRLLLIEWSLCSAQTGRPLPREWLRNVPAEEVRPTTERLKHPGNFWVPLPPKRGHYYLRLRVFDGGSEAVQTQTRSFK